MIGALTSINTVVPQTRQGVYHSYNYSFTYVAAVDGACSYLHRMRQWYLTLFVVHEVVVAIILENPYFVCFYCLPLPFLHLSEK